MAQKSYGKTVNSGIGRNEPDTYAKRLKMANALVILQRLVVLAAVFGLFFAADISTAEGPVPFNPARVSGLISKNSSLFTCAVSYTSLKSGFIRSINRNLIDEGVIKGIYAASIVALAGIAAAMIGVCASLGNVRFKRLGAFITFISSAAGTAGVMMFRSSYVQIAQNPNVERLQPLYPAGIGLYVIVMAVIAVLSVLIFLSLPKPLPGQVYEMPAKYKLFLMMSPFLVFLVIFAYLPLWGLRYAFYDYRPGFELTGDKYVGFKWFTILFENQATRNDVIRVLKNTLGISGLGIAMSWLPMAFAIFLSEMAASPKRIVQTLTTIPNFISWVLVYSVAFSLFSTEGFVNSILISLGVIDTGKNFLMDGSHLWLKMWLWSTWKGLGWGAIVYIAAISGIDQQLYEAATVDGAGRFKKMLHITLPGLVSTFCVLLLLGIAGVLSNGVDQFIVFRNSVTQTDIEVLDYYVYRLGLGAGTSNIPLATVVGMCKSVVSVILLFGANSIAKLVRGEGIV